MRAPQSASIRSLIALPSPENARPIPYFIDRRRVLCAQIPGLLPEETQFIDLLSLNPATAIHVIDFASNERLFLTDISFLQREILPSLEDGKHASLARSLGPVLVAITGTHARLLSAVEDIAKRRLSTFLSDFIDQLQQFSSLLQLHEQYLTRFLPLESAALSISYERSAAFSVTLEHRPLIHLFRAPLTWQSSALTTARALLATRLDPVPRSKLEDFARSCDRLIASIDTVPQLEAIARRLVNSSLQIVVSGRRILREGNARKHCRKNVTKRELFLFSDVFVYAQQSGKHLLSGAEYPLCQLRVAAPDPEGACLAVYSAKKSFVLEFADREERAAWEDAIQAAVAAAREGAEDADVREAPIWVPDAAAKFCTACRDKFTSIKRRHHCRCCGNIYCGDCLHNRLVPKMSDKPVPCCDACLAKVDAQKGL
jgi:hypothetical protein